MQGTNKIVVFSSWVRAMMSSTHSVLFKSVPYLEFGISFKIYFQVNRRNQDYCILFFCFNSSFQMNLVKSLIRATDLREVDVFFW